MLTLLKIILFLIIGFALYKMFGGKFTLPRSKDDSKTMVQCDECGAFVSEDETKVLDDKVYCSDCRRK